MMIDPFTPFGEGGGDLGPFDYANPYGMGNRTADLTVSSPDFLPTSGVLNNIVDGATGANINDAFRFPAPNADPKTVIIQFPVAVQIDQVQIQCNSSTAMGNWQLSMSMDGVSYTAITGIFNWASTSTIVDATLIMSGLHLQLTKTSGSTNSIPWFLEIYFRIRLA